MNSPKSSEFIVENSADKNSTSVIKRKLSLADQPLIENEEEDEDEENNASER